MRSPVRGRFRSVRSRLVLAAVGVVGSALAVGVVLLLVLLQRTLTADVEGEAVARVRDVMSLVRLQGTADLGQALAEASRIDQVVQVIAPDGRVVAASSPVAITDPLTGLSPPAGTVAPVHTGRIALLDRDSPFVVAVGAVEQDGTVYRVVVAESIRGQQHSVGTVLFLLLVTFPVLLALVALAAWSLVGRALHPVERIRAQVSRIGRTGQLDQRVGEPDTHDEVAALARTMNEMLARLETARSAQRRFVADAGHELRSPVTGIAAVLDVARDDPEGATLTELAPVLEAETARIGRLIEDLLLLAGVDERGAALHRGDVDLDELVEAEVVRLRARTGLAVQGSTVPVRIRGDRDRLVQVLANLGDNAARHARSGIRLSLTVHGEDAVVRVDDDGSGIPVGERDRVFDRFVRLDESRHRDGGGSGLGLAIVRELVRAHGGTVRVTDADGGGCRVELTIPIGAEDSGSGR